MQAEQQAETKEKADEKPKPEPPPKTRDDIKREILAKPEYKRTKKEKERLEAIKAEEEAERRHGALIHKLTERADKWGRREIGKARRTVTDDVAVFSREESAEVKKHTASVARVKNDLRKQAKAEMQKIQEELNNGLAAVESESAEILEKIRSGYRGRYKKAEDDLDFRIEEVADVVGNFTKMLGDLTTEQLEQLHKEGTLQIGDECVAVPDAG